MNKREGVREKGRIDLCNGSGGKLRGNEGIKGGMKGLMKGLRREKEEGKN